MKHDDEDAADLNAVRHDDEFLNALIDGRALPDPDPAEQRLAAILFAWRTESLADPIPVEPRLPDVEKAIAIAEAERKRHSTYRHLRLVSGAAAITALAAAGLLVLSENSQPGDPLWNVKKVVFAEEAQQTQATVDVQNNLERAEAALAAGDTAGAVELVNRAERDLAPVSDKATRERMQQWIQRLRSDEAKDKPVASSTQTSPVDPTTPPTILSTTPSVSVTVTVTPSSPSTPPSSTSVPPSKPSSSSSSSSISPSPAAESVVPSA